MKKHVSLLALILVGAGAALADGSGEKSDEARRYARQEFARCVKAMTGKAPPELKFTAADAKEGLGPDGFRVIAKNSAIEIRSEKGRGALYGVYDVLERFGGAGFYTRECEVLPKRDRFIVPDGTDYSERPAFGDLAASIKPTASGWVLRQNLGAVAFDEDTDYVLRLQVKAKRLAGAGDGDAFSFGYFDTTSGTCGEVTRAKASETEEQGAWYELPARKLHDGLQLWFAPGEDAAKTLESLEVQNIEIIAVGDR